MTKKPASKHRKIAEMSAEYKFDCKKAKPNRFASTQTSLMAECCLGTSRMKEGPLVVVLAPDVAKVFTSTKEVNKALRAIISAMPKRPLRPTVTSPK